jgi:hypothetical protein
VYCGTPSTVALQLKIQDYRSIPVQLYSHTKYYYQVLVVVDCSDGVHVLSTIILEYFILPGTTTGTRALDPTASVLLLLCRESGP